MPVSAQAYTTALAKGSYGSVEVPRVAADGRGLTVTNWARTIGESPDYRNSAQRVCVTHRLWEWIPDTPPSIPPSWKVILKTTQCGWISAEQDAIQDWGAVFSGLSIYDYYYTDLTVTWKDRPGGTLLGRLQIRHTDQSDYQCSGPCHTSVREGIAVVWFDF